MDDGEATEVLSRYAAEAMIERTKDRGGGAVGTGNSMPEYISIPGIWRWSKLPSAITRSGKKSLPER